MDAGEVSFLEPSVAAAVVAAHQDSALELIAPHGACVEVRSPACGSSRWMVMCRELHRARRRRGARFERLRRRKDLLERGARSAQVESASAVQGRIAGPVEGA